jgi:hypothetical protein
VTVIDLNEAPGAWFDMEGGGRIQLRSVPPDAMRAIRKQTVKKRVDYPIVAGQPRRFEYEELDEDLQNELLWDYVIVAWENLFDRDGKPIPCTRENKVLAMNRSKVFSTFFNECLKKLLEDEAAVVEEASKN